MSTVSQALPASADLQSDVAATDRAALESILTGIENDRWGWYGSVAILRQARERYADLLTQEKLHNAWRNIARHMLDSASPHTLDARENGMIPVPPVRFLRDAEELCSEAARDGVDVYMEVPEVNEVFTKLARMHEELLECLAQDEKPFSFIAKTTSTSAPVIQP